MRVQRPVSIVVYNAKQCDPKKCTALKLKRFGLIRQVIQLRYLPKRAVVLNPFSEKAFSPADRDRMEDFGLVGLDCSWEQAEKVLLKHVRGTSRCLPVLVAGNPVNFGKLTKLTTAEALAAALYIAGFRDQSEELLSVFKWGHTFLEINSGRLEVYASAKDSTEVVELQKRLMLDARTREDAEAVQGEQRR
jgi:pre-rRNA-processing protein TSR3